MGTVFMNFIELVMEGGWREMLPPFEQLYLKDMHLANFRVYFAGGDNCELRLVEPEIVIRRFLFNFGAYVQLGNSVVAFESRDIKAELSVDEDMREGKRLKV